MGEPLMDDTLSLAATAIYPSSWMALRPMVEVGDPGVTWNTVGSGCSRMASEIEGRIAEILATTSHLVSSSYHLLGLAGLKDHPSAWHHTDLEYDVVLPAQIPTGRRVFVGVVRRETSEWRGLALSDEEQSILRSEIEDDA